METNNTKTRRAAFGECESFMNDRAVENRARFGNKDRINLVTAAASPTGRVSMNGHQVYGSAELTVRDRVHRTGCSHLPRGNHRDSLPCIPLVRDHRRG